MKKFIVLLFGIYILGFSMYGVSNDSYYVQLLINVSTPYIYARIALIIALVAYAFIPNLRIYTTKALICASGFVLLLLGLFSIGSPSLLGYSSSYVLFGDSVTLIEGGILAIVLSAELTAKRTQYTVRMLSRIHSLFVGAILTPTLKQSKNPVHSIAVLPIVYKLVNSSPARRAVSYSRP